MSAPPDSSEHKARPDRVHYCPDCRKPLQRREGKRGPFWGCTGFPECRTSFNDIDGAPSTALDERFRCPLCTRPLIKADPDRGEYWFCSGYSKGCKVKLTDIDGVPEKTWRCRDCGSLLARRQGKHGEFWGCSRYPDCTSTYRDKDNEPDFDFFTAKRT